MKVLSPISSFRFSGCNRAPGTLGNHPHKHIDVPRDNRQCNLCIYHRPLADDAIRVECRILNVQMVMKGAQRCQTFLYFDDLQCVSCPEVSMNEVCKYNECKWIYFRGHSEEMRRAYADGRFIGDHYK